MSVELILILFLAGYAGYILVSYFIVKFITKFTIGLRPYPRLLILSFLYALFWGLNIAATGGDPGIGFPAPNIVAIGFTLRIGFYLGAVFDLYILGFWWVIIFLVMLIKYLIENKKQRISPYRKFW